MSEWLLAHLRLSLFTASGVICFALLLLRCARDPVVRHRTLVCFLPVLLLMPAAQIIASVLSPPPIPSLSQPATPLISLGMAPPHDPSHRRDAATDAAATAATGSAPPTLTPTPTFSSLAPLLPSVYAAGVATLLLILAVRVRSAATLLRLSAPVDHPDVLTLWRPLVALHRAESRTRLLQCDNIHAPGCWGIIRSSVVLPGSELAPVDPGRLSLVLRHELVHVARRDVLASLAQHLLRALLWFNPLVWIYSILLSRYRELSCDAIVLRQTGQHHTYAMALLEYCRARPRRHAAIGSLGLAMAHRDIQRRLNMILLEQEHRPSSRSIPTAIGASLAALAFACSVGAAAAFGPGPAPAPPARPALLSIQNPPPEPEHARAELPTTPLLHLLNDRLTLHRPKPETFKSLRIEIPAVPRDPAVLSDRAARLLDQMGHAPASLQGSATEQETLISGYEVTLRGSVLTAPEFVVNMPEGSRLRSTFEAESIELTHDSQPFVLKVRDGVMRLTDEEGVDRITIRASREGEYTIRPRVETLDDQGALIRFELAPPAGAVIHVTIDEDGGEVVMRFKATKADGSPANIEAELDLETGVPADEKSPPPNAVRYQILDEGHEDGKPLKVKMQWFHVFGEQAKNDAGRAPRAK